MSDGDMDEVMADLRAQFLAALPEHATAIAQARRTLSETGDEAARRAAARELLRRAHRLAGNSAMVGFPAISEAAAPVEEMLRGVLDAAGPPVPPAELAPLVARLLAACDAAREPEAT
jgi:chemotaxis protein histidine kinase CheA